MGSDYNTYICNPRCIKMEVWVFDPRTSYNKAQGHQTRDIGNLQQPKRFEVAQRTNGDANEKTESAETRPQPEKGSVQQ